ncbi:hypothetical protein SAMN00777080_0658 [Aquiflexum balticum DSM 16537]|uniref:Uncharacterized protein n=1 Tax=Aquiflexum balticum DSM 16537 TaxID=758820 RepID=A0A1W2GZS4_9BACT|nr:hypothetical protein SAMN00777080_0658 [Aquiflexum balticum DSM 16537]
MQDIEYQVCIIKIEAVSQVKSPKILSKNYLALDLAKLCVRVPSWQFGQIWPQKH